MMVTERKADRSHSPCVLGFVRSDYRQQVIVHQEITHSRITEERITVTPNTPDRQVQSRPITSCFYFIRYPNREFNMLLDDISRSAWWEIVIPDKIPSDIWCKVETFNHHQHICSVSACCPSVFRSEQMNLSLAAVHLFMTLSHGAHVTGYLITFI